MEFFMAGDTSTIAASNVQSTLYSRSVHDICIAYKNTGTTHEKALIAFAVSKTGSSPVSRYHPPSISGNSRH